MRGRISRSLLPLTALLTVLAGSLPARGEPAAPGVFDEYQLGVEDKLLISVWKETEPTKSVTIRPDGKITYPLVGDIQAAGRTARQLTDELAKQLARFIKEPVVTVVVEEINSFKVFVVGEVNTQGALSLKRRTRLLEAIASAGGLSHYADKSNVVLLRFEEGKETRTRIDYRKIVSGERPDMNVYLKPGDTIIVN